MQIAGKNATGEIRASACADGILPGEHVTDVWLEDIPLDADGRYTMSAQIDSAEAMDQPVGEVAKMKYITSIDVKETIIGKIFHYAHLQVYTSGGGGLSDLAWKYLKNPYEVKSIIERKLSQ